MEALIYLLQELQISTIILVLSFPSCLALLVCRNVGKFKASRSAYKIYIAAWSRVSLDMALVWGIALSCLVIIGMITNFDKGEPVARSISVLAKPLMNSLMFVVWGGIAAGVGYSLERGRDKFPIKLKLPDLLIISTVLLISVAQLIYATGLPFVGIFLHPVLYPAQVFLVALLSLCSCALGVSWQEATLRANITTVLVMMAFAIVSWFLNWSDFQESSESIYVISHILFWGCALHINFYLCAMVSSHQSDSNLRIKAWHLTEAYSFFTFLIVAPVGVTEYLRESKDQQAIEEKLQAQRVEIDSLRSEIMKLKKNN